MKLVFGLLGLIALSACVAPQAREARCSCFTAAGDGTGKCDFEAVAGAPAVFNFTDPTATLSTKNMDECP